MLSQELVDRLCVYLVGAVLHKLRPGQRMLMDFSVTNEPDDGTFYRDDLEKNYSLHYNVLVSILDFLHEAEAPVHIW